MKNWISGPVSTAATSVPTPTLPPRAAPTDTAITSVTILAVPIFALSRRPTVKPQPSMGPLPRLARMYAAEPKDISTMPASCAAHLRKSPPGI